MITEQKRLKLLLKDCTRGFYQQMYFWGKDVMHPSGNLLQAYGFKKSPSQGLRGTSCYTYESEEGEIQLYGSCAGYYTSDASMVFLRNRCRFYQWLPEEKLIAGLWTQSDILGMEPEEMFAQLTPFFRWWSDYEQWIEERMGSSFREQCHAEWNKVNKEYSWLPPQLANQWLKDFITLKDQQIRPKHYAKQSA